MPSRKKLKGKARKAQAQVASSGSASLAAAASDGLCQQIERLQLSQCNHGKPMPRAINEFVKKTYDGICLEIAQQLKNHLRPPLATMLVATASFAQEDGEIWQKEKEAEREILKKMFLAVGARCVLNVGSSGTSTHITVAICVAFLILLLEYGDPSLFINMDNAHYLKFSDLAHGGECGREMYLHFSFEPQTYTLTPCNL